ncbi:MAG: Lcl C-terminal domain-containing protein [Wenzhouxiangella sp.]
MSCLCLNLVWAAEPQVIDVPLPNGDFSQGLAGWTVEMSPTGATPPGSVQVVAGSAVITKGGAFQVGLHQGFAAPDGLQALRFRLTQLPQFASSGGFIPEAFDVHVTGPGGFTVAAAWRPGASSAANAAAVPSGFNLGDGVTFSDGEVRIPLPAIASGTPLNVAATLVGASGDTTASVALTDVVMEVLEKPEPPEPPVPDRLDGCGIFRDRFEVTHGVGFIARCASGQINDTGITACAGGDCPVPGLPGQDAEFGRDALALSGQLGKLGNGEAGFDFTKLDIDGEPLPASASEWACVRDNYTGLVWEAKQNNAAASGHFAHTFSWYQPDGEINGGSPGQADGGSCQGTACDTRAFVMAFNEARVCGVSDWRLPTRQELASIVHAGRSQPSLDPAFFPLGAGWFWTATPVAADPASAWLVDFDDGSIRTEEKTQAGRVRLVREVR